MRKDRESRFQASHVFTPGRSGADSQAVIQNAVQQPLLPNNMELIDTRRQVDTNKITML